MINRKNYFIYIILIIAGSHILWGCNPNNTGHVTEIDSAEYRNQIQLLLEFESGQHNENDNEHDSIQFRNDVRVESAGGELE